MVDTNIATAEAEKKEISCRFIRTLIKCVKAKGVDGSNLFEGMAFPAEYYMNPSNWVSRVELEEIEQRAVKLTNEKTIMYQVGFTLPELNYFGFLKQLAHVLLNPLMIYKDISRYSRLFTRTSIFNIKTIRPNFIEFSMREMDGYPITENRRYYINGFLAAVPTIWKLKPAAVFEKKEDDEESAINDSCTWEVYWENSESHFTLFKNWMFTRLLKIHSTIAEIEKNFVKLQQRNEELLVQNEQLAKIREIALKADGSRSIEDIYRGVVDEAGKIPGVGFIMVYCKDNRDKIEVQYHSRSAREAIKKELEKRGFHNKNGIDSSVGLEVFHAIEVLKSKYDYKCNPHVITVDHLYDIFRGNLPKAACSAIQKLYSADKVAIVPVMVDGREWGTLVLLIQNIVPVHLLEMIASHLSVAVKNVSTMQYLKNKNTELAVLNDFSIKIANVLDLEKIFKISIEEIQRVFNSDSSCIYVFNEVTGDLDLIASLGDTDKILGFHECLEKNERLLDSILNSGPVNNIQEVFSNEKDNNEDKDIADDFYPDWPYITAKLQLHKKPYGFIVVCGKKEKPFTETEQSLLIAICNQISIGMENAKLHEAIVLRMKELEAAKNMLTVSEEKLQCILESVDIGIMTTDLQGKIVQINDSAVALYRYTTKFDLIGRNVLHLVADSDRQRALDCRKKLLETGYADTSELLFIRCDGAEFLSEVNSAALLDTSGEITGFVLGVRDISEQKVAELKLKESEEKYRTIFDFASDMMFFLDRKGNILDVNKRIKEIIGYDREEFIGRNITRLNAIMPRNSTAILLKNFVEQMSGNYIAPYEVTIIKKNGERAYLEVNAVAIKKDGNTVNDLAIMRDITQRKQAEKELRKKQEMMYRIITSIPNSVIVVNRDMEVVMVNRAFLDTFKYRKNEAEKKPLSVIINVPDFYLTAQSIFSEKNPDRQVEFSYVINNRSRTFVATYMKIGREDVLVSISDMTEERQKQESMYLTDRLVSVGEMASGIAHELNNPLTSVVALSQIVANQDLPKDVKEDVLAINNEAQRAATVVRNMLSFARKHVPERQFMQMFSSYAYMSITQTR